MNNILLRLSVIMPVKNNLQMTREAVESLLRNSCYLRELVIVDDMSRDDIKSYVSLLSERGLKIIYHRTTKNTSGVNKAWNIGAALATMPYIAIVNNDILFSMNWDKAVIDALDDNVWMTSPYHTYGELPLDFPEGAGRKTNITSNKTGLSFLGSCFAMKKETWEKIGPIDERLNIWCGDNYIFEMIKRTYGKQIKEITESYIHHFGAQTVGNMTLDEVKQSDLEAFDVIVKEKNWDKDVSMYPWIPDFIDLRSKLPMKTLHNMKVLNVGVGSMESGLARQLPYIAFKSLTHIDTHEPYIENAKTMNWISPVDFIVQDLRDANLLEYDLVMIFDVIEHLEKKESLRILENTKINLLIFLPLEKEFRPNPDGVEEQDHLSLWTEEDFKELGFTTTVLKDFHGTWDALWATRSKSS